MIMTMISDNGNDDDYNDAGYADDDDDNNVSSFFSFFGFMLPFPLLVLFLRFFLSKCSKCVYRVSIFFFVIKFPGSVCSNTG